MKPELKELYQEIIIDHGRSPRNKRVMPDCACQARGKNPLCGDTLVVFLKIEAESIADISFEGEGCAISMASASLMTESVKGKSLFEARETFKKFHEMVTDDACLGEDLGKLSILSGVKAYPARVKCATLAWHTFVHAMDHTPAVATTE